MKVGRSACTQSGRVQAEPPARGRRPRHRGGWPARPRSVLSGVGGGAAVLAEVWRAPARAVRRGEAAEARRRRPGAALVARAPPLPAFAASEALLRPPHV